MKPENRLHKTAFNLFVHNNRLSKELDKLFSLVTPETSPESIAKDGQFDSLYIAFGIGVITDRNFTKLFALLDKFITKDSISVRMEEIKSGLKLLENFSFQEDRFLAFIALLTYLKKLCAEQHEFIM